MAGTISSVAKFDAGSCYGEGGPLSWHGGDSDGSLMGFHSALDDGEAKSGAGDDFLIVMLLDPIEPS